MHTPPVLDSPPNPAPEADLDLLALLDLFTAEEPAHTPVLRAPVLRTSAVTLRGWVRHSSRRAARWGAVPTSYGVRRTAVAE